MKHLKTFESFVNESKSQVNEELGGEFNLSGISRSNVQKILITLSDADVSYDFDGSSDMLSFDSTELDKGQIQTLKKLGLTLESAMNESKISLDKLKLVNSISIQGNPNKHFEAEFGKDIEIPAYPKEGDVTFKKKKIGFISNWNGLVISDMAWIKDNIDKLQNIVKKTGLWYNF